METALFETLRKLVSGEKSGGGQPSTAPVAEPPALVIARRERPASGAWGEVKSWFGGAPKLGTMAWPRDAKGAPLYFVAQLDLSEIAEAGAGRTALPTTGALAFFVGGAKSGGIVHVKKPGAEATPAPRDLCNAADIGGDPLIDPRHRFGPIGFPFWPVEFRELPVSRPADDPSSDAYWEALEVVRDEQAKAIARLYQPRASNISADGAAKAAGLAARPLYWLAALMFAERLPRMRDEVANARARGQGYIDSSSARLKALDAGHKPPPGQGTFGDPAKERANSESWLATGRKTVAGANAQAAAVGAYVAEIQGAALSSDPWALVSPQDAGRLDALFDPARDKPFVDFSRYLLPRSWRDYATDALKLMAAGSDDAWLRLPEALRRAINTQYRLPAGGAHLMFAVGADIQGNEMFGRPDMRMVLQLTYDDMMYWSFGDNGVYQFWMPANALNTADVSKAVVTFECH